MISLIWKYYSIPVAVVPSKWITPLDRLLAFPTRVAGNCFLEIQWWWEIRSPDFILTVPSATCASYPSLLWSGEATCQGQGYIPGTQRPLLLPMAPSLSSLLLSAVAFEC